MQAYPRAMRVNLNPPDNLDLCIDGKGIVCCKPFQDLADLHKLLPSPVVLLFAESMQGVWSTIPKSAIMKE